MPIPQLVVPASLGLASYINARYRIADDASKIGIFIGTRIQGALRERRDTLNGFYILESWARTNPDRIFLIYEGKQYTYRESYDKTLRYGTWLKTRFGIQSEEVVAMDFMNSDIFIWIWFGLWAIGAKPAFINYNLKGESLAHCIRASGSRILLVDEEVYSKFDQDTLKILSTSDFCKDDDEESFALEIVSFTTSLLSSIDNGVLPHREPNSVRSGQLLKSMSALIYTSGTTGLPKPAIVSWNKSCIAPLVATRLLGLKTDDIYYTSMPLYHTSAAVLGLGVSLATGCTLSLGRRFHRQRFWEEVRDSHATVIQYVGETCRYLMTSPPSALDQQHSVRLAFGNGLRPDVWPRFKERFGISTIVEFYGATEGPNAFFNFSQNKFSQGCVGVTGPLMRRLMGATAIVAKVDQEDGNILWRDSKTGFCTKSETNEPGELLYKLNIEDLESQFQGYYRNSGATSKKILRNVFEKGDAYFSSGDVMRVDNEGRWYFCDRMGDTFRWKSENVSTTEVSEVLGRTDGGSLLEEANVYGVQIPGHEGRAGCAALLLAPEYQTKFEATGKVDEKILQQLATEVLSKLPKYAIPIFLRVLRSDNATEKRTGTNKQQKHILRGEGVDPSKISNSGDVLYWLRPGDSTYRLFRSEEFQTLGNGKVML